MSKVNSGSALGYVVFIGWVKYFILCINKKNRWVNKCLYLTDEIKDILGFLYTLNKLNTAILLLMMLYYLYDFRHFSNTFIYGLHISSTSAGSCLFQLGGHVI